MSVYRNGNLWWINVTFQGRTYRKRAAGAFSKAQAVLFEYEFRKSIGAPIKHFPEPGVTLSTPTEKPMTVKECTDRMLTGLSIGPSGYGSYQAAYDHLINYFGPSTLMSEAILKFDRFYHQLHLAVSTKSSYLTIYKRLIRRATTEWKVPGFVPDIRGRKMKKVKVNVFTEESLNIILTYFMELGDQDMVDLITIARHTGGRLNEVLGLQKDSFKPVEKQFIFFQTKNTKHRGIPISNQLVAILQKRLRQSDSAFRDLKDQQVFYRWRKMKDATGITGTFHDLRHTRATELVREGHSLKLIADYLGHTHTTMTEIYTHLTVDDLRCLVAE